MQLEESWYSIAVLILASGWSRNPIFDNEMNNFWATRGMREVNPAPPGIQDLPLVAGSCVSQVVYRMSSLNSNILDCWVFLIMCLTNFSYNAARPLTIVAPFEEVTYSTTTLRGWGRVDHNPAAWGQSDLLFRLCGRQSSCFLSLSQGTPPWSQCDHEPKPKPGDTSQVIAWYSDGQTPT